MLKLVTFILCAFCALKVYGSPAKSQESSGSVCLLKDAPNQCGSFCLSALGPLYHHMAKFELTLNKTQESQQKSIDARLERMQIELTAVLSKLQHGLIKTEETSVKCIPSNFEKIGSRFFYIVQDVKLNWTDAEDFCLQKGGHLASIQNEEEFNAIVSKLENSEPYFLGINDRTKRGDFVSVASGKQSSFFKWDQDEPFYQNDSEACVAIDEGLMRVNNCTFKKYFICQADIAI
ncbi:accessory gland protein Acp29AB-like [Drosophila elegans]|uniref:accessory gland protein Acp29AB-like n=1 Tax=Drosophila elegans TaxID=30023 RepID=UPI0007E5BF2E|nr:accessory gland protein Acp29AB-like [Drosophila elegans]